MRRKIYTAFSWRLALPLAICMAAAFAGCRKEEPREAGTGELPDIAGKKVVMVIASELFRDEELFEPKKIIEKAGGKVLVASSSLRTAKGMLGGTAKPGVLLKDVKANDFDAVVFVGGSGAKEYWKDPAAHSLAKAAAEKGKLVCAICIAPATLANAGLLKGKKVTAWPEVKEILTQNGATYTGADLQVDGKFITAEGPKSVSKFGNAIVRALGG